MKSWRHHYQAAEQLLEAAAMDNSSRKDNMLRMAQVHATLAVTQFDPDDMSYLDTHND